MTDTQRNSLDTPGTSPIRAANARNFVLIIAITMIVLLGLIITFALRSNTPGATKSIDASPARSTAPSR